MGFTAIVPKEHNRTRTDTRLYMRVQRADYYMKWQMLRVVINGYATKESGYKMKLSEDYYRDLLRQTLDTAMDKFLSVDDAREVINEKSLPVEDPYNEPEVLFSQSYNFRVPDDLSVQDVQALYAYIYEKIKTDTLFSEIEDVFIDPSLEEIATY